MAGVAAISLMRRRDDVTLSAFRRHWLDVHGPLVCGFPGLRSYVQDHVIEVLATNAPARAMRIDGFPILAFNSDEDRQRAHRSPEMAGCNIDSKLFIGAVSRVICEPRIEVPQVPGAGRVKLIALLEGSAADEGGLARYAAHVRELPRLRGLVLYHVLQQGPAPNSTIPHLPVSTGGIVELSFASMVDLECAMAGEDTGAAHFVVEEHCLC